jgi:outer membrane protein assembly factor BamB
MLGRRIAVRLPAIMGAMLLWLILANNMGTTASCSDLEQVPTSFSAFSSNQWTQTTLSDFSLDMGSNVDVLSSPGDVVLGDGTDFLFAFRGANSRAFWRYDTTVAAWTSLSNAPGTLRDEGASLASDGARFIYATQGGSRQFWRYDTEANSWATLAHTPSMVRAGGGLSYDGAGHLYALQGGNDDGFWRYDVSTGSWSILASTAGRVSSGGSLVHDGDGHLYALQGNGRTSFWRYDVASGMWASMASSSHQVRYGGSMTYDGADSIYMVPGWYQDRFQRYSISEDRWYALSDIPEPVGAGASLAFSHGGDVYAFSGISTRYYWRYDIATDIWQAETPTPARVGEGSALCSGMAAHALSGTLTSTVLDTLAPGTEVQGLYWDEVLSSGTDITFEMRASETLVDGEPDSAWVPLGDESPITSGLPVGRYLQWRVTLTSAGTTLTPVLQEVRVYHS